MKKFQELTEFQQDQLIRRAYFAGRDWFKVGLDPNHLTYQEPVLGKWHLQGYIDERSKMPIPKEFKK
jgi:hypothetical protein